MTSTNSLYLFLATAVTFSVVGGWIVAVVATAALTRWRDRVQKRIGRLETQLMRARHPDWRRIGG